MRHFYSPSTKGFFNDQWFALDTIPSDAVEISEDHHTVLIGGQSNGKVIVHDDKGFPYLIEAQQGYSKDYLAENYKVMADANLRDTDWTQQMDVAESLQNYKEFVEFRKTVRAIRAADSYNGEAWPKMPTPVYKKG